MKSLTEQLKESLVIEAATKSGFLNFARKVTPEHIHKAISNMGANVDKNFNSMNDDKAIDILISMYAGEVGPISAKRKTFAELARKDDQIMNILRQGMKK